MTRYWGSVSSGSIYFEVRNRPVIINLDDDSDDSEGTLQDDDFDEQFIRPTLPSETNPALQVTIDPESDATFYELLSLSYNGLTLKSGKTVELQNGDFLRITSILRHRYTKDIILRGFRFQRLVSRDGILEFQENEVVRLLKFNKSDSRSIFQQSIESSPVNQVVKIRELVKTNSLYPAASYCDNDPSIKRMGKSWILAHCRLVCRWNQLLVDHNQGFVQRLTNTDSDEGFVIHDQDLRRNFRETTVPGGSSSDWLPSEEAFDRAERTRCQYADPLGFYTEQRSLPRTAEFVVDLTMERHQRYTFGDGFCGAGGASRGAKAAGARVEFGFDYDPAAIKSYAPNFYQARCEAIAAHEFVTIIHENFKVDILHLSPPCQPFSPIHTREGKDDEINQATLLAVQELIKKSKPRIVTLEETFGLTRTLDNISWFKAMVRLFTNLGFSVRWKVFNLCDFGLSAPRKRLIIFASCPGEALPEFPEPTHCKVADARLSANRSPVTTINDVINHIPADSSHHNPEKVTQRNEPPYNGDLPLRNTITCQSGATLHPSGKRNFTLREISCLQGFPLEHQFGDTRVRKQIGNAFPPIVAKVFFEQIIRALRSADGL